VNHHCEVAGHAPRGLVYRFLCFRSRTVLRLIFGSRLLKEGTDSPDRLTPMDLFPEVGSRVNQINGHDYANIRYQPSTTALLSATCGAAAPEAAANFPNSA